MRRREGNGRADLRRNIRCCCEVQRRQTHQHDQMRLSYGVGPLTAILSGRQGGDTQVSQD